MVQHKQTIEQYFKKNPPASLAEASAKIEELTGVIKRGLTQTGKFLKSIGIKFIKVASIPGKAITEKKTRKIPGKKIKTQNRKNKNR